MQVFFKRVKVFCSQKATPSIKSVEWNVERLGKRNRPDRIEICNRLIATDHILTMIPHGKELRDRKPNEEGLL